MKQSLTLFCLLISIITQAQVISILASATDLDCHEASGAPTGAVDITVTGGESPYTYAWSTGNTVEDLTGLSAGTYTVTITDALGDTASDSYTISEPTPVEITGVATNLDCNASSGAPTGGIDLTVSGGQGTAEGDYSYAWTTTDGCCIDVTSADQYGLSAGTYCVVVTDSNGCTVEECWTLTESGAVACTLDSPIIGVGGTNVLCAGDVADIYVTATGGVAPYTYSISGGIIHDYNSPFSVETGTYTVYTYDANDCQSTCEITITGPEEIEVITDYSEDLCQLDEAVVEILLVEGGTGPYEVTWTTPTGGLLDQAIQTIEEIGDQITFTGAQGGETYIFSIIDANGCRGGGSTITIHGSDTGEPLSIIGEITEGDFNVSNGSIDLTINGGTPPYNYIWNREGNFISNEEDLLNLANGPYSVTVTDSNNCSVVDEYTLAGANGFLYPPHLCLVTNEYNTGKNVLLWEDPTPADDITLYHIYREGLVNGNFVLVGKTVASAPNRFVDQRADPAVQAYKYHVRAADNEGNESVPSNEHKTVHLTASQGLNGNVNLHWDDYEGLDYDQVAIYRGTNPQNITQLVRLPAGNFSYTDLAPLAGEVYYQLLIPVKVECRINRSLYDVRSNVIALGQTSSLEELSHGTKIYPNPASDIIFLQADKDLELRMTDVSGKLILREVTKAGTSKIDVSDIKAGLYFMTLKSGETSFSKKIIIN